MKWRAVLILALIGSIMMAACGGKEGSTVPTWAEIQFGGYIGDGDDKTCLGEIRGDFYEGDNLSATGQFAEGRSYTTTMSAFTPFNTSMVSYPPNGRGCETWTPTGLHWEGVNGGNANYICGEVIEKDGKLIAQCELQLIQ